MKESKRKEMIEYMKENMSLYIESKVKEKVEAFAKAEKRSKSNAVEYLLELGLKQIKKEK